MLKFRTNYKNFSGRSVQAKDVPGQQYEQYRQLWEECPRTGRVPDFPLNIDLEITNACNLRCPHCARTQDNWGDNSIGFMDDELVKKVITEVKNNGGYCIKFSLRGEPLLHKNLPLFLNWCSQEGIIDFYFNTNGVLLNEDMARALVMSKVPRVSISVGGWDAESFRRCQVGAELQVVLNNVAMLKKIRTEMGSPYPKIRIQAVLMDELKLHLRQVKELWKDLADEIGLIDFREETGRHDYRGTICTDFYCNYLWQRLVVLWNGDVLPCLFHGVSDTKKLVLGNVKEMTLKELWDSDTMNKLRREHMSGLSHKNSCCDTCSYRFTEINKIKRLN